MKFSTSIITYFALQTFTYSAAAKLRTKKKEHQTRFIVKFKDHGRFEAFNMLQLQSNPKHIMALPDDDIEVMSLETEEEIRYWEDQDDVEYVEPDHKIYLLAESVPWGIAATKALEVSDDPVSNQKVCIIDTGYDINHPDLPSSTSIVSGNSQIASQSWTEDGHGHGTHVAGTIAAIGGNNMGVVGVNRNGQVKLHIVKIFDNSGSWTHTSNLIQAVESCAAAGSTVVNMSLGCNDCFSQAQNDAFARIYNQGVLLVAAAGNYGNSAKSYPASYSSVMSVAAVDKDNNRASFSQYNDVVDIAAPGVDILSTFPGGGYKSWQGTSMASPHVAGVAALVWSHFPTKTAQEIRQALESSAQDLGSSGKDNQYGHGLVRADLAYASLNTGGTCTDTPVGWYDSDGPYYDCAWYSEDDNCAKYGNSYANQGKTANQACCACGGGSSGTGTGSYLNKFNFFPFKDSSGNDIGNRTGGVEVLAKLCDSDPNCRGFNSNGWLKHTIRNQSQWSTWTSDPTKGFYVKK